jgi:hypothetical protein
MDSAFLYGGFAFSVLMGGVAVASLIKSPEERWDRKSFWYNYGAFIFYAIIAAIGFFIVIQMYHSGKLAQYVAQGAVASGLGGVGLGAFSYLGALATPFAVRQAREEGVLPSLSPDPQGSASQQSGGSQKSRRKVGHGRYNT